MYATLTQREVEIRVCGLKGQRLAGDGTVIEAACSHYNLLKEQALREHAQAMRQCAGGPTNMSSDKPNASSAATVMQQMLDQVTRIAGDAAEELLLDAGYFDDGIIQTTLARDISLLCPSPLKQSSVEQTREGEKFRKSLFRHDPASDTYRCPACHGLQPRTRGRSPEDSLSAFFLLSATLYLAQIVFRTLTIASFCARTPKCAFWADATAGCSTVANNAEIISRQPPKDGACRAVW